MAFFDHLLREYTNPQGLKLNVQDIVSIAFNNEIVVCLFFSDISKFLAGHQFHVFEDLFSTEFHSLI